MHLPHKHTSLTAPLKVSPFQSHPIPKMENSRVIISFVGFSFDPQQIEGKFSHTHIAFINH